jgi:hypothetical protein
MIEADGLGLMTPIDADEVSPFIPKVIAHQNLVAVDNVRYFSHI